MPTVDTPSRTIWRARPRLLWAARTRRALVLSIALTAADAVAQAPESTALAVRGTPAGATLFTRLPATETGITAANSYDDPSMWGARNAEFKFGAIGTGIAVGDYDNDGRPDLLVVNKTEPLRLYRNLGDWRFSDVTAAAGLVRAEGALDRGLAWFRGADDEEEAAADLPERWKQGAAFADVNNDGWLDLHVCRFGATNWLFINQGDGTFTEEAAARGLAVSDASSMGAFCDYDRDGWLDLYLQTNLLDAAAAPAGQPDRLFRNNGDGTFTDVTATAGIIAGASQGHAAIWWDYDADGWPDLYIANDFAPPDHLYRNLGDGTFADVLDRTVPHTPHSSMGADLGDLDGDGRIDLLVADMAATTAEKDQRGMAKIRSLLDTAPEEAGVAPQIMRNALYLATGTGRLREAAQLAGLAATDWTWSVRLEDLDCDGRLDVHVTNGMVRELHNADMVRRLSASESVAARNRLERDSPRLDEANLAFRNLGDLRFEEIGAAWGLDEVGVSFGAACGDFDGDGDLDLVHANYEGGVSVLRNDATDGHRVVIALRGSRSNRLGLGAIVRLRTAGGEQVRPLVSARGYLSTSEPVAHFGLGSHDRIERLSIEWPSGHVQTFEDLPADRRFVITEPSSAVTPPPPRRSYPAGLYAEQATELGLAVTSDERPGPPPDPQPLLPRRFDRSGPDLGVGDLDGDGYADVLLGGTTTEPPRWLRSGGANRPFAAPQALRAGAGWNGPLALFDADGDGDLDVLLTRAGGERSRPAEGWLPELWLNDGRGGFTAAAPGALPERPLSVGAVSVLDYNRDGRPDLFIGARLQLGAYPESPSSVLWRNDGGRFTDVTADVAPALERAGLVTAATVADLDGDGWSDLLLAREWGSIGYLRNEKGQRFTDESESAGFAAAGSGWWSAVAAGDFNGDGVPDIAAGNAGLNTPYDASPERPVLLYHGDFSRRGRSSDRTLIEAFHDERGRLVPRRPRLVLAGELRMLERRFRRDDDFAAATLPEIVGEEALAGADRYAVTELRSGVFLSQPGGGWRFAAWPRIVQIAPIVGFATGDFDADGHPDLFAIQNDFSPIGSVGRFDGGLGQLLRGGSDAATGLVPMPPAASGLVVPGAARAVAWLPRDEAGEPVLLVSRNREPLLAFGRRASP